MTDLVVDTHVLIWMLMAPTRLSQAASSRIQQTVHGGRRIIAPTICLVEIAYLIEKYRLEPSVWDRINDEISLPGTVIELAALTLPIAEALRKIPASQVPDMPDRIIAATSLALSLPLVTRDRKIASTSLNVIW